jgi:2-polyprenyl-6-methoxyphenol hydroxylase-like FAD-dependent oxidoreductase
MSVSPIHVIIIGGGIGGLCLAQGLKRAGVSVAVYERNPATSWLEGYRIHINPVGSAALHTCLPPLLWEAFVAIAGKPPAGLGFLTEQLAEMVVIAEAFMSQSAGDPAAGHHPVNRIALRHLLLAGMSDIVHFDKAFERYEQAADGKVTAFFADGTQATGDLLVAADGANSRVRKQYLPQAQRVETGAVGVAGKLPLNDQTRAWLPQQLSNRMNLIMPPHSHTLFTTAFERTHASAAAMNSLRAHAVATGLESDLLFDAGQDYLLWAFIAHAGAYPADAQQLGGAALQRFIGQTIAGWHPCLRRLIAESDPRDIALHPFKTATPIAPWPSSNVTLLGDALHNMPPVGGLGGNMALRDASLLVHTLATVQRGQSSLLPAIQAYEAEIRAYGFAAVDAALGYTRQAIASNRLAREVDKTWFRLCNALPPLKRVFEDRWTAPMRNQAR